MCQVRSMKQMIVIFFNKLLETEYLPCFSGIRFQYFGTVASVAYRDAIHEIKLNVALLLIKSR